tara:strand:- start:1156 stop:2343 length:1188 start_codon:yes stop_codon:yes gene_type:complete
MKKLNSDVVIIGAGLTGLLAAYALCDLSLDIIVVDKFDFVTKKSNSKDLRTTAIAEGSKEFLEKINLWQQIASFSEPIKDIKVIDRVPKRLLTFKNPSKNKNLGYIVRNTEIKKALLKSLSKKKNIKLVVKKELNKITTKNHNITCNFNDLKVQSKLLIAADGKNSSVRNINKTPIYKKEYKQKALVINLHHEKNHKSTAFEIFLKSGPLAILPMKKIKKNYFSSSLIWSHETKYIDGLYNLDKKLLSSILHERIYDYVGNIKEIVDVQKFNLSSHINTNFTEQRTMYLGDAAHSLHPIAGQGWNLGIRDIEKCLQIIKENNELGLDLGNFFVCNKYQQKAYYDAYTLFQITDKLNSIFLNDSFFANKIREKGFGLINKKGYIKNYITNFAMGFN